MLPENALQKNLIFKNNLLLYLAIQKNLIFKNKKKLVDQKNVIFKNNLFMNGKYLLDKSAKI